MDTKGRSSISILERSRATARALIRGAINGAYREARAIWAPPNLSLYLASYAPNSIAERRFYNIGAGRFRHPVWTNVDHPSAFYAARQRGVDLIEWDLLALTPVDVATEAAEVVYSSHTVEHISDLAAANLFREAHRILKIGGTIRITMPDMSIAYQAFLRQDRDFYRTFKMPEGRTVDTTPMHDLFLARFATSTSDLWSHQGSAPKITKVEFDEVFAKRDFATAMNWCASRASLDIQLDNPGNHVNWWTAEKAVRMLKEAGFDDARISACGQSFCPILRDTTYFDSTMPAISLYVEANRRRD